MTSESNLIDVPHNSWRFNSGTTTHVSNMMRIFLAIRITSQSKMFIYMRNCMKAPIEGIRTYRLILDIVYHLNLYKTLLVSSMSMNLVSLSKLDNCGFKFNGGHGCFNLCKNSKFIVSDFLIYGLYRLKCRDQFYESLLTEHQSIRIKHNILNESFAYLLHKRLGHVSKERIERLVKNEILQNPYFTDLRLCVNFLKGKKTKHS